MAPLPTLPIEIKAHILKFCDQPTLAKTSGLSLAFLELSSPLLYNHIHVVGAKGLHRLLCERTDQAQPHLSPFLDLPVVSLFTFEWDDEDNDRFLPGISFDRVPPSQRSCQQDQITDETLAFVLPTPARDQDSTSVCRFIFPLFSPTLVRFSSNFPDSLSDELPNLNLETTPWSHLHTLSFRGVRSDAYLLQSGFFQTNSRSVTVVLDFSGASMGSEALEELVNDLLEELYGGEQDLLRAPKLKQLVVKVATKEVESRVRHNVERRTEWKEAEMEYRSRLRFEVVQTQ